jgi:hypothetical protein
VALERTNATRLKHLDGAVSTAHNGSGTARGLFAIVIGDQLEIDFGSPRNPDGQGFAVLAAASPAWMSSRRFKSPTEPRGLYGTESLVRPIAIVKAYRRQP